MAASHTASTVDEAALFVKIWRICRECYVDGAFSGDGARRFGGRWNSRGVPMVYASTSLALASIELFVHLEPNQAPSDLVAIAAELSPGEPSMQWQAADLPPRWWSDELAPMRALGDRWMRENSALAVLVPSVPIRIEWNVLVNPLHPALAVMHIEASQPFAFDSRMFSSR